MSLSPRTLSIERRERHPYRSLYAEMLLQSFHDALAAEVEAPDTEKVVEGPGAAASEAGRARSARQSVPAA
jgi:hypothetical protein